MSKPLPWIIELSLDYRMSSNLIISVYMRRTKRAARAIFNPRYISGDVCQCDFISKEGTSPVYSVYLVVWDSTVVFDFKQISVSPLSAMT